MNTSRPGLPSSSRRRSEGLSSSNRSSRVADNNCDDDGQPSRPVRRPQILQSTSANATSQSTTRETNATILAHHMRQPRGEIRESTNSVRRSTISELPPVLRGPETRTRNETATTRFQPEEARAQIVNLEQQLERLQERLLQNRFLEGPVWGAGTENGQSGTTPRTPVTVTNPFDRQLNAAPTTGLRLSSESASGSSHNSMSGGAEERLRALHQLTYMDVDPSPAARRLAILEDARGLDGMRNTTRRRRSATARAAVGGSLTNADMPRRLWRLQDSSRESAQQIDSELESLHDTASRRYNNSAVEREHDRERLRQVWGDIESDDYVSPLTSLFVLSVLHLIRS
ncbi:hypothetical protein EDC01DRAFT_394202 [Geopyxis carbonaria]|nr:hypothetical protein EDC01DRAFT_394202 [Geopyxis carbonaria]